MHKIQVVNTSEIADDVRLAAEMYVPFEPAIEDVPDVGELIAELQTIEAEIVVCMENLKSMLGDLGYATQEELSETPNQA